MLAALAAMSGGAMGDVILDVTFSANALFVAPGETAQVRLVLRETVTAGSASLLVSEQGLSSMGVSVALEALGVVTSAVELLPEVMINEAVFFDASDPIFGPVVEQSPVGGRWLMFAREQGAVGEEVAPGVRELVLATLTIRAGLVEGETTVVRAGDYDGLTSDSLTWRTPLILDETFRYQSVVLTVIPGPGVVAVGGVTLGMTGMTSMFGMNGLRRRRSR